MTNETPFMTFWRALNEECRERGLIEPTYGPAKVMFAEIIVQLRQHTVNEQRRQLAA